MERIREVVSNFVEANLYVTKPFFYTKFHKKVEGPQLRPDVPLTRFNADPEAYEELTTDLIFEFDIPVDVFLEDNQGDTPTSILKDLSLNEIVELVAQHSSRSDL